jgi:hypothetical protein
LISGYRRGWQNENTWSGSLASVTQRMTHDFSRFLGQDQFLEKGPDAQGRCIFRVDMSPETVHSLVRGTTVIGDSGGPPGSLTGRYQLPRAKRGGLISWGAINFEYFIDRLAVKHSVRAHFEKVGRTVKF